MPRCVWGNAIAALALVGRKCLEPGVPVGGAVALEQGVMRYVMSQQMGLGENSLCSVNRMPVSLPVTVHPSVASSQRAFSVLGWAGLPALCTLPSQASSCPGPQDTETSPFSSLDLISAHEKRAPPRRTPMFPHPVRA